MTLLAGFHKHHIVPRYMGGDNSPKNLVLLHPMDHAIAHFVRHKIYGNPADAWAFNRIVSGIQTDIVPYAKGFSRPYMKKPKSEETKRKMSEAAKGRKKSAEAVEKMRKALTGRKATGKSLEALHAHRHLAWAAEAQEKKSAKTKGVPRPYAKNSKPPSIEACVAGGKSAKGRTHSHEHIKKREASRRLTRIAKGQIRQLVLNGIQYESAKIAADLSGIPEPTLKHWAYGKGKPSSKYAHIIECRWE